MLWRDPDTGRQTSLTYDDEREARVARELIEAAGGRADEAARIAEAVRVPGPTVEAAVTEHIDLLNGVGPDTRSHYRGQLRTHIAPVLGPYPVAAITYRHIAGWVRAMGEKGLSPKTIANVHGLLSAAITTAVRLGYRGENPCVGVELPTSVATHDEMTVLTRDEFALLLGRVPAFYQPLVLTLVATGLRWGEATALTAGDVDLTARPATIRVTKAWKRDADRRWYVGPPKTRRARRTVSLPDDLVDVLLPLVADKAPDALLFTNTVGSQLSSSRFWTTTWTPALDAACDPRQADGTPDPDAPRLTKRPRVHDLRHTHASWMIAAGTDLFVLQRRLGHESITTTTETYAHLLPDQQRAAADAAGKALGGLIRQGGRHWPPGESEVGDRVTRKHPRVVLRRDLADEAPWTRQPQLLAPDDALIRVSRGSPWVVHWCGGPSASSADDDATWHLDLVREYQRLVGPAEQSRMVAKAERKGRTHTVVLADLGVSACGTEVVVFVEGHPWPWLERPDPFTSGLGPHGVTRPPHN